MVVITVVIWLPLVVGGIDREKLEGVGVVLLVARRQA